MKAETFLILVNIILIVCSYKIEKNNYFEAYKNLRNLEEGNSNSSDSNTSDSNTSNSNSSNSNTTNSNSSNSNSSNSNSSNSNSSNSNSSNSNSSNPTTETIGLILLGLDNYNYNKTNNLSTFLAKFYAENKNDYPENVTFNVEKKKLRLLEEKQFECYKLNKADSNLGVYNCGYNGDIGAFKITYPGKMSDYAEFSLNNITNQKGDKIYSDFFLINNCYVDPSNKDIKGITDYSIKNNSESYFNIYVDDIENGVIKQLPITFIKKDGKNIEIKLDLNKIPYHDLNLTTGVYSDDGKKASYLLYFKEGSNSTYEEDSNSNYEVNPSFKQGLRNKNSGGLSAGGIVAIIIPCVAALIAALGLVFFLNKNSKGNSTPVNMGNNTIGINSSTNIVNK